MRKILLLVYILCFFTGCIAQTSNNVEEAVALTKVGATVNNDYEFDFPEDWKSETDLKGFDLYYTNGDDLVTQLFIYNKSEFDSDKTPEDIIQMHADNLATVNVKNIEKKDITVDVTLDDKIIKTIKYSGRIVGTPKYYFFSYVGFKDNDEFLLVTQKCEIATYGKYDFATFENIIKSCRKKA